MIMCYKIINGLGPVARNCSNFFSFNNVRTRGHNFKLYLPECRLDALKISFARRVCLTWNNLSFDVVNADSLNSSVNWLMSVLHANEGFLYSCLFFWGCVGVL